MFRIDNRLEANAPQSSKNNFITRWAKNASLGFDRAFINDSILTTRKYTNFSLNSIIKEKNFD